MKIKFFPSVLIIALLVIFGIFYKSLQNSNIYTPNVNTEKSIPLFFATIFPTNNKISSEEVFNSNKFYLMNIWASWCLPCRDEHIFLMNLSKKKNIEIIGLNYKDKNKNAKNFLDKLDNPYEVILSDQDGTIAIEWGAYGVPETFLIYNKKIIKRIIGPIDENSLVEIKRLIQ
jgi:cytochrome c biogenesis protein CcmG, thiol:disulfide interchange protein DsbE